MRRTCLLLIAAAAAAQAAQAQAAPSQAAQAQAEAAATAQGYHVLVLHNSESASAEGLAQILTEKFNTDREKVLPLIEKIDKEGKAVVIAGAKESCEEAAKTFEEIGLKTEVRPLEATGPPPPLGPWTAWPAAAAHSVAHTSRCCGRRAV
jgi:ATP-dependent Clp protease adapter protein ClpS